jgi:prepilin-type N-terminal cleavage/methylation domain-containing protein
MDQTIRQTQRPGTRVVSTPVPEPVRSLRMKRRAFSLVELTVAIVVLGVLCSVGIPRFQQSLEQSRADIAGANLRAVWSAQRLYWLQNRAYAPDLNTLLSANLIDPSLTTLTAPYSYSVTSASESGFTATATRSSCPSWSGSFSIAADGTFSGSVQQPGDNISITPGFQ